MEKFKISIITPSLNMGRYIEQCIRGVQFQGYENYEHIVIYGGSTDQTLKIIGKYNHIKWISERRKS